MANKDKNAVDGIPMTSPDGRPWVAETETEAMDLMVRGYRRNDDGEQAPPAESATGKPANAPSKTTPGSTG